MSSPRSNNVSNSTNLVSNGMIISQVKSFQDAINNLFTDLQKLMQNVKKFKLEHSDVKKQWNSKVLDYLTINYFQMKLMSITEYIQFQKDLNQTLSMIHSFLQKIKNYQYSQKDTQHKSITDLIQKIDFLSGLIQKCQKIISSEKNKNDIENQSKLKSIYHLSQILKTLQESKTYLMKFQQSLKKNEQIKMDKNDRMTQNQKQESHKSMNVINQDILKNISQTMSSLKTPKQTTNFSSNSLYYKYQIQNLQFYKNLKQNVEFMLKQTENRNESQEGFQSMINHYDFMVDKIIDSIKKIDELETYKSKCTISSSQFESHFGQIMGELLTVKQNLQKEWKQKINQQEVLTILRSTQEINQNLQKTLIKNKDYKNVQVFISLKNLHEINDKNILIKQNMMKILTILKHQQKESKKNKEKDSESRQNQHHSEDQDTTTVPCVYSQQQMDEEIRQRLNRQTIKMAKEHQREIEDLNNRFGRMKNEFETKINQLQFQLIQKDSKIMQMIQKQQNEQNKIKLQKKQSLKQAQIDKQHLQRQEEMKDTLLKEVEEKRNDKNNLIKEVNDLNEKIKQLSKKVQQLSSSQAILAVSIDQKATQLQNLQQQIKQFTKSQRYKTPSQLKDTQKKQSSSESQQHKVEDNHKQQQYDCQLIKVKNQLQTVNKYLQTVQLKNSKLLQELTQKTQQLNQINQKYPHLQQQQHQDKQQQNKKIEQQQKSKQQIKSNIDTQSNNSKPLNQNKQADQQLKQTLQQINQSILQTINQRIKSTVDITQLNNQVQSLQKQLQKKRQIIQKLNQQIQKYKKTIQQSTQINRSNNDLLNQVSTLQQSIRNIKAQCQNKINQIKSQNQQLSSSLQFEKGKNQANLTEIVSLKQQNKQLTDQKIELKLAIQKITLQTQNLMKEKNTIIQNIKKEINLMQAEKIDFENKIKELNEIKNQNQKTIKAFNEQTVQQKHKIETQGKQIEGLTNQKKQLQNHVVTLQKVQKQKIKLDTEIQHLNNKIQQLNNKIKELQQENQKNDLQTKNLTQSRLVETKDAESYRQKLKEQYQRQKLLFQQSACKKIDELITNFNNSNKKLSAEKKKHQQQSVRLSSVLGVIYQAMSKMNEFYSTQQLKQYFNTESHLDIINCVDTGVVLNQQLSQQVLVYSVKTIKALETRIRLTEKNAKITLQKLLQSFDSKMCQLMKKIYGLCNKQNLKRSLQQYVKQAKYDQNNKQQQNQDLIDQIELSFNSFVQKVVQMVKNDEDSSTSLINQLQKERQIQQNNLKREIKEYENKYKIEAQNQLNTKDQQITRLNQQLQQAKSDLKTQQDLAKNYKNDIAQKLQEIKTLKSDNQRSSIDLNKKIKQEKDKFDQLVRNHEQKVEDLQFNLLTAQSKTQDLQRQLNEIRSSHGSASNGLSAAKQQISQLKQKLQDKQKQLTNVKKQLDKNKTQLQKLQQQLNKANHQKSTYENQLSQKQVTIAQLEEKLQNKTQQINDLKKSNTKLISESGNSIDSIKSQLAQKISQLKDIQQQLTQNKSLISQIVHALQRKINKKVQPENLVDELNSYQPPVGMKLIYSAILHGLDTQRPLIIGQIQKFIGKTIKKTDMLARYPDTKSMIHQLPKEANNFAFIVFYKTKNNRVFGSFSEGMKKQTLFFSFNWSATPQSEQQRKVDFYYPKDSSAKFSPVQIFKMKYLQYGNGELRIDCIDMTTISANSDSSGGMYYNFDWKTIMNEKEENKVPIAQVELHKVEFETNY